MLIIFISFGFVSMYLSNRSEDEKSREDYGKQVYYLCLFSLGQIMCVLSQQIKEKIVRSILLNQLEFKFQVAFAQSITGFIIMFGALESVRVSDYMWDACPRLKTQFPPSDFAHGKFPSAGSFIYVYITTGFKNLFIIGGSDDRRRNVMIYIVLYCFAQIYIQRLVQKIMLMSPNQEQRTISNVFGMMVPVTCAAFIFAGIGITTWQNFNREAHFKYGFYDWPIIVLVAIGVFLHNRLPKKVRNVCMVQPKLSRDSVWRQSTSSDIDPRASQSTANFGVKGSFSRY